jgi:glycosyltransferase involved in cell wall biosynthesis
MGNDAKTIQSRPMVIALVGTLPPLRGLSSYCRELALALADTRPVKFISFKKLYPASLYPGGGLKEDSSFPVAEHGNLTVRRRLCWYNPLTWLIEGLLTPGDILHAQWWSLPLAPIYAVLCLCFRLRKKPVVFTVHNVLSHEALRIFKTVSSVLFHLGDHFIVHTRQNQQQLMEQYGIQAEKISIIHHGTLGFWESGAESRDAIRCRLGLLPDEKVLLYFGAIRPYKGLDTALEAFAQVHAEFPKCRLLIAGKLWEPWSRYQHQIQRLNIEAHVIAHLDYIPAAEVARYFTTADLVLLPYHHFGSQSGVGAAAIAFGKPMIVTRTGGLPDFVLDPRWVVPPRDAAALSAAILTCLSDDRQLDKMARDSAVVAKRLSWPEIVQKTNEIYDSLCRKNSN